jgi:hypothetical protein
MQRVIGLLAIAGAVLAISGETSLAWGPQGHRAVAVIAERILHQSDPAALSKITTLLATDKTDRLTKPDIADEATWADALMAKSQEARTATALWHTVRFKPDNPDLAAACFNHPALPTGYPASHGPQDDCSVDKISQFVGELKDPQTSPHEKLTALQFLLNLVGDLHDPLYAIDRGDQGGACTAVQISGKPPVRLSTLWGDTLVRQVVGGDPASGAARVIGGVSAAEIEKWRSGNPPDWAQESLQIAKTVAYAFNPATPAGKYSPPPVKGQPESCSSVDLYRADPDYETKALAAVKTQLAKAGVRLARVLRDAFD